MFCFSICLIFLSSLLGCAFRPDPPVVVRLPDGNVIVCRDISWNPCGYNLNRCSDRCRYECVKHLRILDGPKRIVEEENP